MHTHRTQYNSQKKLFDRVRIGVQKGVCEGLGRFTHRHCPRRIVASVVVFSACSMMPGCVKTLLSPKEPRSQYSRYELVRGQFAPQYIEDEYGRKKPNLRGRLLQPE